MRVWITRSEPGASRQAEALTAAGFDVVAAPVITIEATGAPQPGAGFQHVIVLSEQVVRHSAPLAYCRGARVHAIGAATARSLAELGILAEVPATATSEGMIERFADEPLAGQACLIAAGEGGRKSLAAYLASAGARVTEYLCYRRVPVSVPTAVLDGVSHVLVSSQDGFRAMARLWFEGGGDAGVKVIAASDRIAALGSELGLNHVQVAAGAADEHWIAALENQ